MKEVSENPLAKVSQLAGGRNGACPAKGGVSAAASISSKQDKALETQVLESSIQKICSLLSVRGGRSSGAAGGARHGWPVAQGGVAGARLGSGGRAWQGLAEACPTAPLAPLATPLSLPHHAPVLTCAFPFTPMNITLPAWPYLQPTLLVPALLAPQVGFGEAGAEVIADNIRSGGDLNPMVPGRKVAAIFGFCDIRSFTGGPPAWAAAWCRAWANGRGAGGAARSGVRPSSPPRSGHRSGAHAPPPHQQGLQALAHPAAATPPRLQTPPRCCRRT